MAGLTPSAVVIVATVRALKYNGGVQKADLNNETLEALEKRSSESAPACWKYQNVYGLPFVSLQSTHSRQIPRQNSTLWNPNAVNSASTLHSPEVWAKGGEGGVALAKEVIRLVEEPTEFHYSYELEGSIEDKLNQIVRKIYHGNGAVLTANAQKQAQELEAMGF